MSRSENDQKWSDRADREYDRITKHPIRTTFKWFFVLIAIVVLIALIIGVVSWIGSWGSEAGRVTGVQNTREQVTRILEDENSMVAAAENACDVKAAAKKDGDPTLIEDPVLAYRATYRKIEARYNARMGNIFEAYVTKGNPLPGTIHNLPRKAPTLDQRMAQVC